MIYPRAASDLSLNEIIPMITAFSLSDEGQRSISSLSFMFSRKRVIEMQDRVQEAIRLLGDASVDRPFRFPSSDELFAALGDSSASLTGSQLLDYAYYIECASALESFMSGSNLLSAYLADRITSEMRSARSEILSALDTDGNVKMSNPRIARFVDALEGARRERSTYSRSYMQTHRGNMQDLNPALRDGRIVLPVKNDSREGLDGFVHSTSNTGSTVFIEPYRLVEYNNSVILAENRIQVEIAKILHELSEKVRVLEMDLRSLSNAVASCDVIYSYASFALHYDCTRCHLQDRVELIEARHPLLGKKAVPISIKIEDGCRAVIFSGPNAGGKTVSIKTVGLLVMLNQLCGYIPAKEGSTLPVFSTVLTDIGDMQSIEGQLSTFSAHMSNVAQIIRHADRKALVILDELGSGTDNDEGGALSSAIVDSLVSKVRLTLVTSHHNSLKKLSYTNDRVMNASMEFDEKTHRPTFRIMLNTSGESHAIDTAFRMGLPKEIIDCAMDYLGESRTYLARMISDIQRKEVEIEKKEKQLRQQEGILKDKDRALESLSIKLKQQQHYLKDEQSTELSKFIRESRKKLENLVRDIMSGEMTHEKRVGVKSFISDLEDKEHEIEGQIRREEDTLFDSGSDETINEGDRVLCGTHQREGIVLSKKGRDYVVAVGNMRMTLRKRDIILDRRQMKKISYNYTSDAPKPKTTLDLRGYTLNESIERIDTQIEGCLVHGILQFSIIHGYGDGILQRGIQEYLKRNRNVKDYHFAMPEDGGMGKTYVEL